MLRNHATSVVFHARVREEATLEHGRKETSLVKSLGEVILLKRLLGFSRLVKICRKLTDLIKTYQNIVLVICNMVWTKHIYLCTQWWLMVLHVQSLQLGVSDVNLSESIVITVVTGILTHISRTDLLQDSTGKCNRIPRSHCHQTKTSFNLQIDVYGFVRFPGPMETDYCIRWFVSCENALSPHCWI